MRVVMFHSVGQLPAWLEDNFKQFRLFNADVPVYFLTDYLLMNDPLFEKYGIISVNKDDYYSNKIAEFESLFHRPSNDFWTIAATRLIYIENFMKARAMTDVYHFENDVLVYYELSAHHREFKKFPNIAITVGGPDKCMTGFSFFKNHKGLFNMTEFFIDVLHEQGLEGVKKVYHLDMVNEMTLMRAYSYENPSAFAFLPTIPNGEVNEFNSLFDPASWGQFVGGTQGEGPGAKPKDHYIGLVLRDNPRYTVIWKQEIQGRVPYFKYDENEIKINNLHIHSKNLHLYMSK